MSRFKVTNSFQMALSGRYHRMWEKYYHEQDEEKRQELLEKMQALRATYFGLYKKDIDP